MAVKIRSIKFENRTCWRDEDLWGFLRPLVIAELDKPKWNGLRVVFQAGRNQRRATWRSEVGWCFTSGYAHWVRHEFTINLPTKFESLNEREKIGLASTIAHELWHINTRRGGRAVEIALRKGWRYGTPDTPEQVARQNEFYAWAAALPLRRPEPAAESAACPRPTIVETRAEKAARDLARWEVELVRREKSVKRAKRKITSARRKVAYYAKKTTVS
jgi:hypothetical protein